MKKNRILICLMVAILIEIFVFNFWNIVAFFYDNTYSADICNDETILSKELGEKTEFVYKVDGDDTIYNMMIVTDSECTPELFFVDKHGKMQSMEFFKCGHNMYMAVPATKTSGAVGISLYNQAKIISVAVNARKICFSTARIIAMLLIYVAGSFLFSIQRMPDYKICSDPS